MNDINALEVNTEWRTLEVFLICWAVCARLPGVICASASPHERLAVSKTYMIAFDPLAVLPGRLKLWLPSFCGALQVLIHGPLCY